MTDCLVPERLDSARSRHGVYGFHRRRRFWLPLLLGLHGVKRDSAALTPEAILQGKPVRRRRVKSPAARL